MTLWDKLEEIRKNMGKDILVKLYYRNYPITEYVSLVEFIMTMSSTILDLDLDSTKYEIKSTCLSNYFIIKLKKEVFE